MSWDELAGHDRAVRFLRSAIGNGRLGHAYLFEGLAGVGKALAARLFGQAILCENQKDGEACGAYPSCQRSASGNHADWLQPNVDDDAAEIKIEEIRRIDGAVHLKPIQGDRQVILMPDADRMNVGAENAFLKTLEEPPAYAVLVLTSSRPEALLPTTRSRCIRVRFGPLPADVIERLLVESQDVAPEEAAEMARYGAGSLGRALEASGEVVRGLREFAEKCVSRLPDVPRVEVGRIAGQAQALVEQHVQALADKRSLTDAAGRRVEALRLLSVLELFIRDAMLLATGSKQGILLSSQGGGASAAADLGRTRLSGFERAFDLLAEAERAIRQNVRVGVTLHTLLIRLREALR